mmetsp:Transcript_24827/g.74688  ORF Transcript_24827/g.74688 Transcript_24827/m.74688 type:complete len:1537 (+) Transcript_24827:167-4777(+)
MSTSRNGFDTAEAAAASAAPFGDANPNHSRRTSAPVDSRSFDRQLSRDIARVRVTSMSSEGTPHLHHFGSDPIPSSTDVDELESAAAAATAKAKAIDEAARQAVSRGKTPTNKWRLVSSRIREHASKMRVIQELNYRRKVVHICALKLQRPPAVMKVLQKVATVENSFELLDPTGFHKGDSQTMDSFLTADLLVVDYGRDWEKNTDVGFRVGQRHSSSNVDDVGVKLKHSVQLIETEEENLTSFTMSDFSFEKSNSYRIPYIRPRRSKDILVYVAKSLFDSKDLAATEAKGATAAPALQDDIDTEADGNVASSAPAALQRLPGAPVRCLRPATEFFSAIISQISTVKNRRPYPWDRTNTIIMQRQFEKRVMPPLDSQPTNNTRKQELVLAIDLLREHDSLRTEANVLMLLRHLRDLKAWVEMIEVLEIKNAEGQLMSALSDTTADIAHYEALAFYNRGKIWQDKAQEELCKADQERAYTLISKVCEKFPQHREAQGFRGKVFKDLFSRAIKRQDGGDLDHDEIERYHKSAVDAYMMLLTLEKADQPNVVPVWSTSNLALLLFCAPNWQSHKMEVWDYIDRVNMELTPRDIWDSNTLFLINVVGAFLFKNDKYFENANRVVGILLKLRYESWMLDTMLKDLHLINTVFKRRTKDAAEANRTLERKRFEFWVDFLEQSVAHEVDYSTRKFPVLVSSAASITGTGDFATMDKMKISLEFHVSMMHRPGAGPDRTSTLGRVSSADALLRRQGAARTTSGGSTTSSVASRSAGVFDDTMISPDGGPVMRVGSSPAIDRKSTSSRLSTVENYEHVKIQIAPHDPAEVGPRQEVIPIHLAEIVFTDIPLPGGQNGVDERRLNISTPMPYNGGATSYTVMFPSSKLRERFMQLCVESGYENPSKFVDFEDACPEWRFKTEQFDDDTRLLLGEGSFAHVYVGELLGPGFPEEPDDVLALCAVKQIKEEWLSTPHVVADFQSEVHKIRQLKHDNIIEFIALWQGPDDAIARSYLMELLDGSLYTLLDMVGGLYKESALQESTDAIVFYAGQMIDAVHYLHTQHHFCHRDIKPANFLIRSTDGLIKLSDFGTAKDVSGFDKYATGISGSLQYMDPKVLQGGEYGLESDIYCLGSSVWELVTGKHPYQDAMSVQQLIQTRQHADASLPTDKSWPTVICNFIDKCFSEPRDRPTAEDLKTGDLATQARALADERLFEEEIDGQPFETMRREAVKAMRLCMEQLEAEWLNAIESSKSQDDDDASTPSSGVRKHDLEVLLPTIVNMLAEDSASDNFLVDDLASVSSELLSHDGGEELPIDAQFSRAYEVVQILTQLKIPTIPATLKASAESRGNVHFVLKALWSTPYFARHPHVMWFFRDILNHSVEQVIRVFLPHSSSRPRSDTTGSRGVGRLLSDDSTTPFGGSGRLAQVDLTEVLGKLDSVLSIVQHLAATQATPHLSSYDGDPNSDTLPLDPGLISYLERKEVSEPEGVATLLTRERITVAQLESGLFSRDELASIGIPLGDRAKLVPLVAVAPAPIPRILIPDSDA